MYLPCFVLENFMDYLQVSDYQFSTKKNLQVGIESGLASTEKSDGGGALLIHHSRNTEHKQWAETQVLTISGVARVFVTKRSLLHTLGDFPKAWRLLLEHVERLALSSTQEVSLAALKVLKLKRIRHFFVIKNIFLPDNILGVP